MLTLKRFGITTGAAAAAAAKAAALHWRGVEAKAVTVPTPVGLRLEIYVERVYREGEWSCAEVRKFSGDNPDVLDGAVVKACFKPGGSGVSIRGGRGVGVVTRPGLPVPPGEPAINPVPRAMIAEAVREAGFTGGEVVVEVPEGERLAELTMNRDVGVVGGVSILGTTGIETPVSDEDYIEHVRAELRAVRAVSDSVVIATGNRAVEYAKALWGNAVVKVGDLLGEAAKEAASLGFRAIVVAGLPAKIVKVAAGAMNTHSRYCDGRIEALTHAAVSVGVPPEVVKEVAASASVGEALVKLGVFRGAVLEAVARRAKERLSKYAGAPVEVVIFYDGGELAARA
ncbi:cobalt-precorrin-5B (C(1))-methyltransferase CbiD [Pyrobaculum neutrophilum]|uniref:Cobalt-precorrin-5B C(1)-methyltransferase n=1 Tax=Pyrobaculum neutrophilum (strain DSM 2338 / JCM 9278 / NBRC 100436 / V24Sta) TaxID=444157 RepID=B1YBB8_PYRNV|nr:cobalt-precorrin-5B (C(1))-methyltransferase CbiD [Pyrobaculum neutrophilum]ACB39249.1 cobalamin biosynthesis protein CbiD [Pyrobaculum neutrophilum V24Sta]